VFTFLKIEKSLSFQWIKDLAENERKWLTAVLKPGEKGWIFGECSSSLAGVFSPGIFY